MNCGKRTVEIRHPNASADTLGRLRYTYGQRKSWAAYSRAHGRSAEAAVHQKKADEAAVAYQTLTGVNLKP